jgi:hypothetical protein
MLWCVVTDIDYVKLMDDKTSPKDILAPYLTSANINNLMKLAAKIPDKVSHIKEILLALVRDLFTFSSKVIRSFILL